MTLFSGGDPNLQHAKGIAINRKTLGWNAAAATFAYGYGTLATLGCKRYNPDLPFLAVNMLANEAVRHCTSDKFVGQDQLIGGTWPGASSFHC